MKILIPTIGTRGDVQPFIALSQGLQRAGHTVTLASHPIMQHLVESHEVTFAPIGPDIDLAQKVAGVRQKAHHSAAGLISAMRFGFDILERSHADILALCQGCDLIVVPTAVATGKNEAELLNIPYLSVTLMPWAIPWDDPQRPWPKRLAYGAIDGLVALMTTLPLNRIRKRQGLPPVGKEGFTSARLNLVPVSPAVFALNPLWEERHHVVGYWFAETPSSWQPSKDLLTFLEAGNPPLLISLGAMSLGDDDALANARLFVEAAQQAGNRAIIQGWDAGMRQLKLPETILAAGLLPHDWLLPRCSGIVHHGGFGTTAAGLRAGIPHFIIPSVADQFYWGQRIHELGVGLPFMPRPRLTKNNLVAALSELPNHPGLHEAAVKLGTQIRAEPGVETAVKLIEEAID
jgi:sterol 3beta-glucosyltransferase